MRWIPAAVFFAAAIFVAWYNGSHPDKFYLAYLIDFMVPSSKGDVVRQGDLTVMTLGGCGIFFLFRDLFNHFRDRFGQLDDTD